MTMAELSAARKRKQTQKEVGVVMEAFFYFVAVLLLLTLNFLPSPCLIILRTRNCNFAPIDIVYPKQ